MVVGGIAIAARLSHLPAFWDNTCRKLPGAAACIYRGSTCSFARAEALVGRLARYLCDCGGVRPGDRVALAMPNCGAFFVAYWATLRLGAIVVPVNIRLRAEELQHVLAATEPRVVFTHEQVAETIQTALRATGISPHVVSVTAEHDGVDFPLPVEPDGVQPTCSTIAEHDPAIILFTSGTTGLPKGAVMRHQDLRFNVFNAILAHSLRQEDVHLLAIPAFAPTAAYSLLPSCAYLGSPVVIASHPYPAEFFGLIDAHRCTTFIGVPTMLHMVTHDPQLAHADLSSLRLIAYSGSPMPVRTISSLRERFPTVALHNFFGLTETISMTHVLPSADALQRADSIGKALPEIHTRIVDEDGVEVPPSSVGELCFRRDNVISGYWRDEGRLEEAICDGWFHTGDLASCDEDGYFYLHGRKKDMIIVAGQNVYALEVEKVILGCPQVREVAVVGIPATGVRAPLGELVKAVVVPQPEEQLSEQDVKRHCSRHLPSYKVPQVVEFREQLPRNAVGKILKRELA